jgi:hypothetical protein
MIRRLSSIFLLLVVFYVAFYPSFVYGNLNVKLIFEKTSELEQFIILLDELRIHSKGASNNSGWIQIYIEKKPLDISKPENYEYILAQDSRLPVGDYDEISLNLKESIIEINGSPIQIMIHSPIMIQSDFSISRETPKDLTLLFRIDMENTIEQKKLMFETIRLEDN